MTVYERTDELTGGFMGVWVRAIQRFNQVNAAEAAAAMAYYALFSLFPLLLFLIAVSSSVLESEQVQRQLSRFLIQSFPTSREFIEENLQQVLALRGPVSLIGLAGLLWSASGFFNTLAYHINRAWQRADVRSFLKRRLVALGLVGSLAGLLILSILLTTTLNLLAQFRIPLGDNYTLYDTTVGSLTTTALPLLIRLLIFMGLYRWVPNIHVHWTTALGGAVVATLGWELITAAFTWYLGSGLVQYEVVYGSLGTMIALMLWIYLGGLVTLFGAHFSAAITRPSDEQAGKFGA